MSPAKGNLRPHPSLHPNFLESIRTMLGGFGGGGGLMDHGSLVGLGDDDHAGLYPGIGQTETITGQWILSHLQEAMGVLNADEYAAGSSTGGLAEAITALSGSDGMVYCLPKSYPIDSNYTIPANAHVVFAKGAYCTVANGVTLTINGTFEAGPYQIFSCTGTGQVLPGAESCERMYAEWWGAKASGDSGDASANTVALTATAKAGNQPIQFLAGTYYVDTVVEYTLNFRGAGRDKTIIRCNTDNIILTAYPGSIIKDLTIKGSNNGAHTSQIGINSGGPTTAGMIVENCIIEECGAKAINTGGYFCNGIFKDNVLRNNHDEALLLGIGANDNLVQGNFVYGNQYNGLDCNGSRNRILDNWVYNNGLAQSSPDNCGIMIWPPSGATLDGNIIRGNHVFGNDGHGIIIIVNTADTSSDNNIISDNYVYDNNSTGIILYYTAGASLDYNIVKGNHVFGNGAHGILIQACNNNMVIGNMVRTNGDNGVYIYLADYNLVANNKIIDNTNKGIWIEGAASNDNALIGNSLHGNGTNILDQGTDTFQDANQSI